MIALMDRIDMDIGEQPETFANRTLALAAALEDGRLTLAWGKEEK